MTLASIAIRGGVAAREFRQGVVDLDQSDPDARYARRNGQSRGADAGAEIDDAVARSRLCRRRQQHGIMTGAVARFRLAQSQASFEKRVLGEFVSQLSHRAAAHGRARRR